MAEVINKRSVKDRRHDWNYVGRGIYRCMSCGFVRHMSHNHTASSHSVDVSKELCPTKKDLPTAYPIR